MRTRRGRSRFVWDAIGILLFVVIAFPVYWMIATAFKPQGRSTASTRPGSRSTRRSSTSATRSTGPSSGTGSRTA